MSKPRILAFAGSTRRDSHNKKLIRIGADAARASGADVTLIDLADYPLPLFDEDLETQGAPDNAWKLKQLFLNHHGLLIAAPEYNSSITAVLKNVIDWVSRPAPNEAPLACFAGKTAGLLSASVGALGGLRGLVHVRAILGNIQVLVIPEQAAIPKAHEAFNADGRLTDPGLNAMAQTVGRCLAEVTGKLIK